MRRLMFLLFLLLVAAPSLAEEPAPVSTDAPPVASAPAQPVSISAAPAAHKRPTLEDRFAQANVAHDGHLTLDEAKGGYHSLVRHFQDIDSGHKGYVTVEDIRTWRASQRAARVALDGRLTADNPLRPRHAFQHHAVTAQQPIETSASQTVPVPTGTPPGSKAEAAPQ